jgi:hypothetical protein
MLDGQRVRSEWRPNSHCSTVQSLSLRRPLQDWPSNRTCLQTELVYAVIEWVRHSLIAIVYTLTKFSDTTTARGSNLCSQQRSRMKE